MDSHLIFNFMVIAAFVFAVGGAIYWYAKKVGGGEARHAFDDPNDRKKVLIISAGIIVFAGLIFAGLVIGGVLKF